MLRPWVADAETPGLPMLRPRVADAESLGC